MIVALCALLFARAAFGAGADRYFAPGPVAFDVVRESWTDVSRGRAVPVKLYLPRGDRSFPLILFSHGLGGSRESGRLWAEHWASHGYLCVVLQHVGSDESLWRSRSSPLDRWRGLKSGITDEESQARVADVRFVFDELSRRRAEERFRAADVTRVGLAGHSFGAQTTQAIAGERAAFGDVADPRIKAAIALSPSARGSEAGIERRFARVRIPFFSITGTVDGDVMGTGATPENRTAPFRAMPGPDKFLLVLDRADHFSFAGQTDLAALRWREHDAAHAIVRAATLAFWDAYLGGDREALAWLRDGGFASHLVPGDRFETK